LIANCNDDPSFERVVNLPTRGIGPRTVDAVRQKARSEGWSMWQSAQRICVGRELPARAANALRGFLDVLQMLGNAAHGLELYEQVKAVVEKSGLIEFYEKEKGDKGEARVENLQELVSAARQFTLEENTEDDGLSDVDRFLAHAALEAGDAQATDAEDFVQLMTLHSAKGLEFPLVFLVGMEEGLFPSLQSLEETGRLEEERRLCYVGMTRAKQLLYLSFAESRRLYGRDNYPRPSRFLREIPAELLQEVRMRATVSRPVSASVAGSTAGSSGGGLRLGQRVRHAKFGEGVVLQREGEGAHERVQVNFEDVGMKWLMAAYARLETGF